MYTRYEKYMCKIKWRPIIIRKNNSLELYFAANEVKDKQKMQIQLLSNLSVTVYKLIRKMCSPASPSSKTYEELIKLLEGQFVEKMVVFKERKRFYNTVQKESEKILEYFNGCIRREKLVCPIFLKV